MNFATQQANINTNSVRRDSLDGREYVVAPVVAVQEMVLKGELLPESEIAAAAPAFNGRPLPVGHPTDDDGNFVSANSRDLWETATVGWFFEAEMDDTALVGEVWVDIEKSNALASNVDERMGQPLAWLANHLDDEAANGIDVAVDAPDDDVLEVSTAYWYIPNEEPGVHEGTEYSATQHALKPDHLALLPNGEGECSASDGCGVRPGATANEGGASANAATPTAADGAGELAAMANADPRTPEFDGTETSPAWGDVDLSFDAFVDAYAANPENVSEVDDLSADDASAIAARSMNGNPDANDFDELVVLPVVNPASDALSEPGLRAALSRAPQTEGIDEGATQSAIRSLLESNFDVDLEGEAATEAAQSADSRETFLSRLKGRLASYGLAADGCGCGGNCDDATMDINELHESTGMSVNILKAMSDEERERLAEMANEETADDGGSDDGGAQNDDDDDAGGDPAVEALREEIAELRDAVEAQERDEREGAINTITEHTDLDADTLEGMETDALAAFAQEVSPTAPADYSAFGATLSRDMEDEDAGSYEGMAARLAGAEEADD